MKPLSANPDEPDDGAESIEPSTLSSIGDGIEPPATSSAPNQPSTTQIVPSTSSNNWAPLMDSPVRGRTTLYPSNPPSLSLATTTNTAATALPAAESGHPTNAVVEGFRPTPPTRTLVQIRPDPRSGGGGGWERQWEREGSRYVPNIFSPSPPPPFKYLFPIPSPHRSALPSLCPRLYRPRNNLRPKNNNNQRSTNQGPSSLYRWLTFYIPIIVVAGFVLYILSELFMKHLALRTIQHHLASLPEVPPSLPGGVPPTRTTATPAATFSPPGGAITMTPSPPTALTASESLHSYVLNRREPQNKHPIS